MNTGRSDQKGKHWWRLLELHNKKTIFLFDSFGFHGLIASIKKIIKLF